MAKFKPFDESKRTFESRLLFIREVFMNKYDNIEILTSGINYKLRQSLNQYEYDLHASKVKLSSEDAIKLMKKLNKEL